MQNIFQTQTKKKFFSSRLTTENKSDNFETEEIYYKMKFSKSMKNVRSEDQWNKIENLENKSTNS